MVAWPATPSRPAATRPTCAGHAAAVVLVLAALLGLARPATAADRASEPAALPAEAASFPQYLAELGLHRQAVAELQRQELLATPQWHAPGLGYPYGRRLLGLGRAAEAAELLAGAVEADQDAGRADRHRPLWALALARNGQTAQAVAMLSRLENFAAEPQRRAQAAAVRCLIHLSAAEAAMGGQCASRLLGPRADSEALADLQIDEDSAAFWHGAASAVVPGLGQALGGEWRDAGAAGLVNGGLAVATWSLVADALLVDASLLVLSMTARYYAGNIQRGADVGRAAAAETRRQAARKLADQLTEQSLGQPARPAAAGPP